MGLGIRTYLQFKFEEITGQHPEKFEGHYTVWRAKRLHAILDHYGHRYFDGKTVLELGAGYGAIGAFFGLLNASVTCVEGRKKNTSVIRQRYPFLRAFTFDLTHGWPTLDQSKWDIIIHMGVLYHLSEPEKSLREACRRCDDLILETEVADSDDPNLVKRVKETVYLYDQSVEGFGSRPSPAYIERIMHEENMTFSGITDARCNWELNRYDWPVKNTGQHANGQRRMWFAKKSVPS